MAVQVTVQRGIEHLGFVSRYPEQTRAFGVEIGKALIPGDLILLYGPFGAGKTTLVQGIAAGAGAGQRVTSPSFTLINEYRGKLPLYHVDLFRLAELDQEIEQALESCEEGDGVTLVEWPDLLPADLREGALKIDMQILGDDERSLVIHVDGLRWRTVDLEGMMETALRSRGNGAS
jgi:tRNA threonylcarbamoyladenosine biosynthesis protein TsaE